MEIKLGQQMNYYPAHLRQVAGDAPWLAWIAHVHDAHKVNLFVVDSNGQPFVPKTRGILVVRDGEPEPPVGTPYCTVAP